MGSKIVFSDVDGTLVYKGHSFNAKRFPVMLEKLQKVGVVFGVCTGRSHSELEPLIRPYFPEIISVCCDGGCTYEKGVLTHGVPIEPDAISDFFDFARQTGASLELHTEKTVYLYNAPFILFSKEHRRLSDVTPIASEAEPQQAVYKISLYSERVKEADCPTRSVRLSYASRGIYEFVSDKASKYSAAAAILAERGETFENLFYFGDGENDAELLKSSGRSFTPYGTSPHVFSLSVEHTRDVIGTIIRLCDEKAFI